MTEYRCGDCGWLGHAKDMSGVSIQGLPSMPSGRRDLGYDCPECENIIGAMRMHKVSGEFEHFWDEMNGERIDQ